ncbi:uncharacterized protein LOC144553535 isoform X3 [Carex rostrata]
MLSLSLSPLICSKTRSNNPSLETKSTPVTGADMEIAGPTDVIEDNAIKSIYSAWNISDWKPFMDGKQDICNPNGTAWPHIECTNCTSGASSNSCHIISLNLSSQNINGGLPPEFSDLQWLANLSLYNNSISDHILPKIGKLRNLTYLDLSMNNFSGNISEISSLTRLTYLNLSKNMLSGSVPSKLGDISTLKNLDLSVNMLSASVPSELGNLTNLQVLKFSTNNFSGPLPQELGSLTSLEELYFDSSGVSGSLVVLKPLRKLRILWAFDNDISGELTAISNFTKLEELQIGDLLPPSVSSPPETDSDFSFLKNMSSLRILSLRNCSLTSRTFPIPELKNLTYLDLSFNKLHGKIRSAYIETSLPELTQLFIGGNKFYGSLEDIISKSLSNGELDISFNPISGNLSSYPNLNINFLGTNINAQTLFGNSRGSDILNFIGNKSLQSNITNLNIIGSPFAIKCGANVQNIPHLSYYYHNDSDHLGAADINFDPEYQWVVSNVGSFLPNNNTIDSSVNTDHSISGGTENQALYQTARVSASSLRYYIVGLPDGDGYKVEFDFAEIVIEDQNSWRGLGRRYFNIFIQGNEVEKDFNIVDAANGSYIVITKSYENISVRNRTVDIHFQWAGRGTCCIPHEYTYGPLVSTIRVFRDQPSPPRPGKTARQKAGLVVGIMSLGIASSVIFLSIMYLWWQWIRLGRVMKA